MTRRIGILGGTFDPPHIGHLILAEEAWALLDLDRIYLVPAGDPPHKRGTPLSPAYHRRRMVELSISDNPHFLLSTVDIDRSRLRVKSRMRWTRLPASRACLKISSSPRRKPGAARLASRTRFRHPSTEVVIAQRGWLISCASPAAISPMVCRRETWVSSV